jgi:hypothetical protein
LPKSTDIDEVSKIGISEIAARDSSLHSFTDIWASRIPDNYECSDGIKVDNCDTFHGLPPVPASTGPNDKENPSSRWNFGIILLVLPFSLGVAGFILNR